ncbi:hypothetical protein FOZ61_007175 [Perkinsus olseni]|uniref:Uncharacterized protein n=1 Tax=Perkinsus olseni TaxID=32597 RepID=A0A7J6LA84_PEROL|nr:hypothetical protein FOZ61_007175 [Perkinsus olseni]
MPRLSMVAIFLLHCLLFYKGYAAVGSSNEDESPVRIWLSKMIDGFRRFARTGKLEEKSRRHKIETFHQSGVKYQLGEDVITLVGKGNMIYSTLTDFARLERVAETGSGQRVLHYTAIVDDGVMDPFMLDERTTRLLTEPRTSAKRQKGGRRRSTTGRKHLLERISEQLDDDYEVLKKSRHVCKVTSARMPRTPHLDFLQYLK